MSARRSISVEGFGHGAQPIPSASRVGDVVMTGGIYGVDPATGEVPQDVESQVRLTFVQLERVLVAAGASLDQIVRMTFYFSSREARDAINEAWLRAFPDPESRPARHTLQYDHLPPQLLVQCDAFAVIVDG